MEFSDLDAFAAERDFRDEVRAWLDQHLIGEFAEHRGIGSPTDDEAWDVRVAWEHELAAGGWLGLTWPAEYGGRGASELQEMVFEYEYARAAAPARVNVQGLELLGPTLLACGSDEQKARFLPPILAAEAIWGQGWSEPGAGSDLAAVATRAVRDGDGWVLDGQKVWTTFGDRADWLYVLARTDPDPARRHRGLTMFLLPADQPGVDIRPITNLAGRGEFCEVFLDGARTTDDLVVGEVDGGWKAVMTTLAMERGAALLPVQLGMEREVRAAIDAARGSGALADPSLRARLIDSWIAVQVMRATNLRAISTVIRTGSTGPAGAITKLFASEQHQLHGELEMDLAGPAAQVVGEGYALGDQQRTFLLSRAETIYGGTSEIQRNILAERVLGLPR